MARVSTRWVLRGGAARLDLSPTTIVVLLALLDHADHGIAWCPQTHLVRDLGVARSTIQAAINRLVELGAIVEHEPGRQGRATRYRFGELRDGEPARPSGMLVA